MKQLGTADTPKNIIVFWKLSWEVLLGVISLSTHGRSPASGRPYYGTAVIYSKLLSQTLTPSKLPLKKPYYDLMKKGGGIFKLDHGHS